MNNTQKITLSDLADDAAKYQQLKVVKLSDEKHTEIFKQFSYPKIDQLIFDFLAFAGELMQNGFTMTEKRYVDYIHLHILLHFSTISERRDYTFAEKMSLFEQIAESNFLEAIFREFDADEIHKVFQRLVDKMSQLTEGLADKTVLSSNEGGE